MQMTDTDLISCEELARLISDDDGNLVVLDASHHLPAATRDARAEFLAERIEGARFLDLASLSDPEGFGAAAFPSPAQTAKRLAACGITEESRIVIYDDSAIKTACRAWFILKAYGIAAKILDGGLAKWRVQERPLTSGPPRAFSPAPVMELGPPAAIQLKADILANLEDRAAQIVDARSADRVFGMGDDPVHGGANGRIPNALNVPFSKLFNADGTWRSPSELKAIFNEAKVDPAKPIIATCGSGITACVVLFALDLMGAPTTSLYDGSWSEWSSDPATPKAHGPAGEPGEGMAQ